MANVAEAEDPLHFSELLAVLENIPGILLEGGKVLLTGLSPGFATFCFLAGAGSQILVGGRRPALLLHVVTSILAANVSSVFQN